MLSRNSITLIVIALFSAVFTGTSFLGLARAKIDRDETAPLMLPQTQYILRDGNSPDLLNDYVPKNLAPTRDIGDVAAKFADKSLQTWAKNQGKDTFFVRTASQVEDNLKTNIELTPTSPFDTTHRFFFNVKAFQTQAELQYTGWTTANLNFDFKSQTTEVRVTERLFSRDLTLLQQKNPTEYLSGFEIRWGW